MLDFNEAFLGPINSPFLQKRKGNILFKAVAFPDIFLMLYGVDDNVV